MKDQNNFWVNWSYPADIRSGLGRIKELAHACIELGMRAPLLVTDNGLAQLPIVQESVINCQKMGLRCQVFSSIKSNPDDKDIDCGVKAFHQGSHDGVIAFGGGASLDVGKVIALMSGQSRPLWDFEDVGDNWKRVDETGVAPVIGVPTTAGTGSEVGRAAVIIASRSKIKKIIFHPKIQPRIVFLDGRLTLGLPDNITAATGMDALSHSLEAFCSPAYHPMAEGIAIESMRLIKIYLPQVYKNGMNASARMQMLVASCMGATAFQKGLGGMHALAHALGGLYDKHHGLLNAVLMPYVLKYNALAITKKITYLAQCLNLNDYSFNGFLAWVLQLRRELHIPHTLYEIGIDDSCKEVVSKLAHADPTALTNPLSLSCHDYQTLFQHALSGDSLVNCE